LAIFKSKKNSTASLFLSFDMSDGSNVGRLEMWQQAGLAGLEHPWQGVGLGNYSLLVDPDFGYRNPITAHNLYLDIFSEIGIFALIVWLVLILGTIGQLFWQIRITKGPDLDKSQILMRIGLIGSLVYFSVHSFFETAIYHPPILALLMIIFGLSFLAVKSN
jgi:O-antigen ligase